MRNIYLVLHSTNCSGLAYAYFPKRKCWMLVATDTKNPVGWPYPAEDELLADLPRFVRESWGEGL